MNNTGSSSWQKIRREKQEALSAKLGFDCRNGGRRVGELICEPLDNLQEKCHLSIAGTIVTLGQAMRIRNVLVTEEE